LARVCAKRHSPRRSDRQCEVARLAGLLPTPAAPDGRERKRGIMETVERAKARSCEEDGARRELAAREVDNEATSARNSRHRTGN
jgi:hypothetical protein